MNDTPVRLHLRPLEVPVVLDVPGCLQDQVRRALRRLNPTDAAEPGAASQVRTVRLRRLGPGGGGWAAQAEDGAPQCGDDAVGLVVTALTQVAVRHSPLLGIHAGALAAAAGTVVLPGPSGLGKSTLVACAVREGFGYLSDEVLAVDRSTGVVVAFPRPLALDATAWGLAGLPDAGCPGPGAERLVDPDDLAPPQKPGSSDEAVVAGRAAPVCAIVLVRRSADGPTRLGPAAPGEALTALLRHSFNHYRDPAASFARVVALVRSARLWRVTYSDARDLAATLADRLAAPVLAAPRG